jgi:hypothetical protein
MNGTWLAAQNRTFRNAHGADITCSLGTGPRTLNEDDTAAPRASCAGAEEAPD